MFRAAPRLIARPAARVALPRSIAPARRYLSTAPPAQKSRSWKSLAARLGVAGAIIYYYNTVDVFAEEPSYTVQSIPETDSESETLPTIEAISAERQKRKAVQAQLDAQKEAKSKQQNATPATGGAEGGIGGLEEEADQQGAFNPETGEINWDCPCLGGMAHGPCGDEFKAAFSCFVFSEEEPKGMDCIDKFKDMQNCFRKYPEVYGSELEADDEDDAAEAAAASPSDLPAQAPESTPTTDSTSSPHLASIPSSTTSETAPVKPPTHEREAGRAEKAKQSGEPSSKPRTPEEKKSKSGTGLVPDNYKPSEKEEPVSESEELVPKAAHDAQSEGTERLERK